MQNKSLNTLVSAYKDLLADGNIQNTYQSLVSIIQNLRSEFAKKYKGEYAVANVLHGYIDFTYFYLQNDYLKKHKLKFAIVLNHQKANFELWLLGQTKDVQIQYWKKLKTAKWVNEHEMPAYSVFEVSLIQNPDFDDTNELFKSIHDKFESLSYEILDILHKYE